MSKRPAPPSPDRVISLVEQEEAQFREAVRLSLQDHANKKTKTKSGTPALISLLSDDERDDDGGGGGKLGPCDLSKRARLAKRSTSRSSDSEVEIVNPLPPIMETEASSSLAAASTSRSLTSSRLASTKDDGEIETLGVTNKQHLPHMRQHCEDFRFVQDVLHKRSIRSKQLKKEAEEGSALNAKYCDLCYCYVCDAPAKDCKSWTTRSGDRPEDWHCLASDSGVNACTWKNLRDANKSGQERSASSSGPDAARAAHRLLQALEALNPGQEHVTGNTLQNGLEDLYRSGPSTRPNSSSTLSISNTFVGGSGPYPPENAAASRSSILTKCRKCSWFSRFEHANFTRMKTLTVRSRRTGVTRSISYPLLYATGHLDWCHACGRVASEKDFQKNQSQKYTPAQTDFFLGEKVMKFRIRPHDPRKFDDFKEMWNEKEGKSPEWTYSEADMEEDTFNHRLGEFPTMPMIMSSLPIVAENDIPTTGYVVTSKSSGTSYSWNDPRVAANETEAVLLESRNHRALLEELNLFGTVGRKKREKHEKPHDERQASGEFALAGDIKATWCKTSRTGAFTLRLYLKQTAFVNHQKWLKESFACSARLSCLLGTWFDIFPFRLGELSRGIKVKEHSENNRYCSIPISPWTLKDSDMEKYATATEEEKRAVLAHNKAAKRWRSRQTFSSSSRSSNAGGIRSDDNSLAGTLRRYFSETLVDDCRMTGTSTRLSWIGRDLGIVAHHRDMRRMNDALGTESHYSPESTGYRSYLRDEDHALAASNINSAVNAIWERTKTFPGLLQQLENLGHRPAPSSEGLNVDLLDFQQQSVGWALEREASGVQSFLWTEVNVPNRRPIYFSPILDLFSSTPPKKVRGGMLAEEMGLGKTIISLSLVLQNQAPASPPSGSVVERSDLNSQAADGNGWTPRAKANQTGAHESRGSILSRGTLVVCNVSLVGQWIDEAKSKLKDPGLVYSYHGGSRKRNASILALNSIVVTTYATLASDATYHAKKSGPSYCPPCEKIRWWRIICDESHALRHDSATTKALMNLDAENKWCVTGTPMNTSLNDLKNQLKFIGIDHTELLFDRLQGAAHHMGKSSGSRHRFRDEYRTKEIGNLLFFLRSIMIRHSMKQMHQGSSNDLMSLPPKVERSVTIAFSSDERAEYLKLERAAQKFYEELKQTSRHELSKNYLKMFSALTPLRIAAAGGQIHEEKPKNDKTAYKMTAGESTECSICLEHFHDPVATQCKPVPHVFCRECIEGVLGCADDTSGPCPICRENVNISKLRHAVLPETQENVCKSDDSTGRFVFKSKFQRLVKELTKIRDEEPAAKSLVFSQFQSTLKWMQKELPRHGFEFRTLSGDMPMAQRSKALRDFQNDPPTTIFLLSMRAGAVGINLTQANRVFVMEPAVNPALEAQAIGRVHRLGQRKNVEVVSFFVENSIETRLAKMLKSKFGLKQNDSETESSTGESNRNEQNSDGQCSMKPTAPKDSVIVGNIQSDKAAMMEVEFDLLFGCSD